MSKGSNRRPCLVPQEQLAENWERAFGHLYRTGEWPNLPYDGPEYDPLIGAANCAIDATAMRRYHELTGGPSLETIKAAQESAAMAIEDFLESGRTDNMFAWPPEP